MIIYPIKIGETIRYSGQELICISHGYFDGLDFIENRMTFEYFNSKDGIFYTKTLDVDFVNILLEKSSKNPQMFQHLKAQ